MLLMAILPATLVFISTLMSYVYRSSKTYELNDHDRKMITKAHAFAIETIQLLLLVFGILTMIIFCGILTEHWYEMSLVHVQVPFCSALVFTLAIYAAAIFAIDLVDNRIQLGTWKHPFQSQTFLLTRSKIMPWTIKQRFAATKTIPRRHVRQRAYSSPAVLDETTMKKVKAWEEARSAARSRSVIDTSETTTNVIWSRCLSTTFSPTPDSKANMAPRPRSVDGKSRSPGSGPRDTGVVVAEKETLSASNLLDQDIIKRRDEVNQAQTAKVTKPEEGSSASTPKMLTPPATPPSRILRAL